MSKTVAYLTDEALVVAVGSAGRPAQIDTVCELDGLAGSVRDGVVVDPATFASTVREFWGQHGLPSDGVALVMHSRRFTVRTLNAPVFKKSRDLEAYIMRELAGMGRITDPLFSYRVAQTNEENHTCRVTVVAIDRTIVERMQRAFAEAGVSLASVNGTYDTAIRACEALAAHKPGLNLYLQVERSRALTLLYEDGGYRYSTSQQLFNVSGTPEFGAELAHSVSGTRQFIASSEIGSGTLDHVYVLGLAAADVHATTEGIAEIDSQLPVDVVPLDALVSPSCPVAPDFYERCLPVVSALLCEGGDDQLIGSLAAGKKSTAHAVGPLAKSFIAPAAALVVCLAIAGVLAFQNAGLQADIDASKAALADPSAQQQLAAYKDAAAASDTAAQELASASRLSSALATFPVPGAAIEATIADCAQGLVTYEADTYDASTGQYVITAKADNPDNISSFVNNLMKEAAFDVSYTGYAYQTTSTSGGSGQESKWVLDITLTLHGATGSQEAK